MQYLNRLRTIRERGDREQANAEATENGQGPSDQRQVDFQALL
jgi:hypothetical protein